MNRALSPGGRLVIVPLPADPSPALKDYAHPDRLVTSDWLAGNIGRPGLAIVESDEDVLLYDTGHIPGAVKIDWHTDLNDPHVRDYIDGAQFAALMDRKGIGRDDTVVIYGDKSNWWAAYALWVFTLFGHPDVRLLDGGRNLWVTDGRDTTLEVPSKETAGYPVVERDDSAIRAYKQDVLDILGKQPLIDVRSPQEYTGERTHMPDYPEEGALRGGHIPTAKSIPWAKAADDSGRFRKRAELEELYGYLGEDDKTVVYCRIGERSSHTWFVLTHLLGKDGVRNYDGSWTEWGNAVRVPVAVGEEPGATRHDGMPAALAEVMSDFAEMEGQDKLQLLLEFANELPPLPSDLEEAAMEPVPECQSPLFLHVDADDRDHVRLYFSAPAEAPTTRGFAAILAAGLDDHSADEILGRARRLLHRSGSGGLDQPAATARDVRDARPDQAASPRIGLSRPKTYRRVMDTGSLGTGVRPLNCPRIGS